MNITGTHAIMFQKWITSSCINIGGSAYIRFILLYFSTSRVKLLLTLMGLGFKGKCNFFSTQEVDLLLM